ncbi:AAA family ATPase, partial [Campylobacter jejuni]|nr:AAA family ATPase [Campylobacter jejuni]EGT3060342.1 AAA family ATPase [Campylobacter jejuni]EKL5220853.1 AAA family ATPase [Campylobacter jejuni]
MNKIDNIANFLNKKSKKCLAINGPWGVGKTHLWKQVEKKLSKVNKDKKVVYIDLFGKESYKQILEEIVFKIHGNYNKIMNTFSQITTKIAKIKSAGTININPDAIFSFLKKEDFNNIIVCFDNIERRSDNLSLKEILGLVNLLKEEKECNVVMIFHKGELEEQDNNSAINDKEKQAKQDNSKNWYQTYKEKIIDYEFIINDNSKAAHNIISNEVKYDKEVQNIIFECYQNSCNNLRLLLCFVEHIIYFNKECFMKIKKEDYSNEIFFSGLKMYYDILLNHIKEYYSYDINEDKPRYSIFKKYFDDSCYLNQDDLDALKSQFESDLKEKTRIYFNKCKDKYLYSNLNDIDFAKYIEDLFPKFKNYIYENGAYYSITYYQRFFKL